LTSVTLITFLLTRVLSLPVNEINKIRKFETQNTFLIRIIRRRVRLFSVSYNRKRRKNIHCQSQTNIHSVSKKFPPFSCL